MKRLAVVTMLVLFAVPWVMADTEDSAVFRTRLLPENETPPVALSGASGDATITVRVTRDGRGTINAATVIFEVEFSMPETTTFTGLHIHNSPVGVSGPVVIDSGLRTSDNVTGTSGRITRIVDFSGADAARLAFVSGLLNRPELYYVNLHSTANPAGVIRGQLQRNSISFRPAMSPANEVPAVTELEAAGAARVTVNVSRNPSGQIMSGNVTFDVDYRFPGSVTITGLHIHKAPAGSSGPVVIDSGISSSTVVNNPSGRGNIFRVVDIDSANTAGLGTLVSLISDPAQFYVNLHTTVHPGGAIRGQLEEDVLNFLTVMEGAQEVPPVATSGTADALISVRATRDAAGNVNGGSVVFNVNFSFPGSPVTFNGLHIHNARIGVNGPVLISSGIGGGDNAVVDEDGVGDITRQATIDSGSAGALAALNGLFVDPESYYVNLHTTVNPAGVIRAQLATETYRFRTAMSPGNEIPAVTSTASGVAWLTIAVKRDGTGAIASGRVTFDVNFSIDPGATIVGLHIHRGASVQNGPVVIDSGVGGASPVSSSSGEGNITRSVEVTSASGLSVLADLLSNPGGFYVNLHTTANPGGLIRNQLLQVVGYVTHVAGGGDWLSSVTVTNPSTVSSAHGIVRFLDVRGNPMPATITDPTLAFWIPPSGSVTFNTHNKGSLTVGSARIHSYTFVTSEVGYFFPGLPAAGRASSVVANAVTLPVSLGGTQNTGIAILSLENSSRDVSLTLRNAEGSTVPGGVGSIRLTPGMHLAAFVTDLLPSLTQAQLTGTLTIETFAGPFPGGLFSVTALQFEPGALSPVAIDLVR